MPRHRLGATASAGITSLGFAIISLTGVGGAAGGRPTPGTYSGSKCPFDVRTVTATDLVERLKSPPLALPPRTACAVDALYQPDPGLRAAGLQALGLSTPLVDGLSLDAPGADGVVVQIAQRAIPLLRSPSASTRVHAAEVLGFLQHPVSVPALSSVVSDPDLDVRRTAVLALVEIQDPAGLDALASTAHGRHLFLAADAVAGIARIGGPRAREALVGIMGDRKLDPEVREMAAGELRGSGDPAARAAAERYLAGRRPQWTPALFFAPLLYLLAFMASRAQSPSRARLWAWALYLTAFGSIMFLVNPAWFLTGQETSIFWGLAVLYPLGVAVGVLPVVAWLRRKGHHESARLVGQRIKRCVLLMWGTLALWVVVFFFLMIIGLSLAWR